MCCKSKGMEKQVEKLMDFNSSMLKMQIFSSNDGHLRDKLEYMVMMNKNALTF